jgi:hypothetical protein
MNGGPAPCLKKTGGTPVPPPTIREWGRRARDVSLVRFLFTIWKPFIGGGFLGVQLSGLTPDSSCDLWA